MNAKRLNKKYLEVKDEAEKYINYFCSVYKIPGLELEDVKQNLRLKLYNRIEKYNSKYSFNTFIGRVFQREMYKMMKLSNRYLKKQEAIGTYLQCSGEIETRKCSYSEYDGYDILIENVCSNIKSKTAETTQRARLVFRLMLDGIKCKDIAKIVGRSVAKINKIKNNEIKNAISIVIGEDDLNAYLRGRS